MCNLMRAHVRARVILIHNAGAHADSTSRFRVDMYPPHRECATTFTEPTTYVDENQKSACAHPMYPPGFTAEFMAIRSLDWAGTGDSAAAPISQHLPDPPRSPQFGRSARSCLLSWHLSRRPWSQARRLRISSSHLVLCVFRHRSARRSVSGTELTRALDLMYDQFYTR